MERNGVQLIDFYMQSVEHRGPDGQPGYVDKEFIRITNPGGKDAIEREVKPEDKSNWANHYRAFKEGETFEGDGFKLRDTSFLTKAEIDICKAAKIFTVEQLSSVDEIGCKMLGLNAKMLIQKAQNWLAGSKSVDKLVSKINALEQQMHSQESLVNTIQSLKTENEKKDIKLGELQNQIEELMKKSPEKKKAA